MQEGPRQTVSSTAPDPRATAHPHTSHPSRSCRGIGIGLKILSKTQPPLSRDCPPERVLAEENLGIRVSGAPSRPLPGPSAHLSPGQTQPEQLSPEGTAFGEAAKEKSSLLRTQQGEDFGIPLWVFGETWVQGPAAPGSALGTMSREASSSGLLTEF